MTEHTLRVNEDWQKTDVTISGGCVICGAEYSMTFNPSAGIPRFSRVYTCNRECAKAVSARKVQIKEHEEKLRAERIKEDTQRRKHLAQLRCPRPDKVKHATFHSAVQVLKRLQAGNPNLHVYPCSCGSFHLGNRVGVYDMIPPAAPVLTPEQRACRSNTPDEAEAVMSAKARLLT